MEMRNIKKDITFVLERTDEINTKASSQNENQESTPNELENRLTGSIAQIENKMAIFENSKQDVSTKLADLLKKNEKLTEDLTKVSGIKSQFDSKANIWDGKVDSAEIKKINSFVDEEVKKIKINIENIERKSDDVNKLNDKFITKDEFKDLKSNVNKLSETIKGDNTNNSNSSNNEHLEGKINKLETFNGEFNNKFANLMEMNSQINDEIIVLSGLKSKFDAKAKFWDSKLTVQ